MALCVGNISRKIFPATGVLVSCCGSQLPWLANFFANESAKWLELVNFVHSNTHTHTRTKIRHDSACYAHPKVNLISFVWRPRVAGVPPDTHWRRLRQFRLIIDHSCRWRKSPSMMMKNNRSRDDFNRIPRSIYKTLGRSKCKYLKTFERFFSWRMAHCPPDGKCYRKPTKKRKTGKRKTLTDW